MRRGLEAPARSVHQDVAALAVEVSNLRALVAELKAERDERRRRRLLPADPAFLARLLPALSGSWGSDQFQVRHVLEEPRLASVVAGHGAKSLGKLFARAVDVPIGVYVLVDCGWNQIENVRRWRVDGVSRGL